MAKGKVIFYDDDDTIISQFEELMGGSEFELVKYTDLDVLRKDIAGNSKLFEDARALIFDLARNKAEGGLSKDFEILKDIEEKFHQYRIPIFIHSAFANDIENFQNNGTVWKIEKSGTSISQIVETITKLDESGFLEAFTPGGIIEQNLFAELHKSFTEQFRKGEIEKIINSIKLDNPDQFRIRAIEVFKRIAVRSLMSEVQAPLLTQRGGVNPIEHYYRRISKVDLWTGDILKEKNSDFHLLVITPRCNVLRDDNLLVCPIEVGDFPNNTVSNKDKDKVGHALNDKPEVSGYNRYIPPSPIFDGGKVLLSNYSIIDRKTLIANYEKLISLSDELTNELLGKFGAYFFRTGITPWNKDEAIAHIENSKVTHGTK